MIFRLRVPRSLPLLSEGIIEFSRKVSIFIAFIRLYALIKKEIFSNIIALKFGYVVIDAYLCT